VSSASSGPTTAPVTQPAGATTTPAPTTTPSTVGTDATAPSGDAFYQPPDPLPPGQPGDLIRVAQMASAPPDTTAYRVLYHSRSLAGADIAVSGMVFVPTKGSPSTAPVLTYAHGTTGLADRCAPSKQGVGSEVTLVAAVAIEQGFVVAATDYEGLGTPGVHPFLVGQSEGRSVLDAARAAERITKVPTAPVVIWGHSQGGQAALFAAELAPAYAPDLAVKGAVAGAPAVELGLLEAQIKPGATDLFGFVFMAAAGFKAAYPQLDLHKVFTPAGVAEVAKAADQCVEPVSDMRAKNPPDYLTTSPAGDPAFAAALAANTAGEHPTPVPIFVYHGDADNIVAVTASAAYVDRACRTGGYTISRRVYPGANHITVIPAALGDIESWITDRLAGKPAPSTPCPRR